MNAILNPADDINGPAILGRTFDASTDRSSKFCPTTVTNISPVNIILMRLPSFSKLVRTFYAISNATSRLQAHQKAVSPLTFTRATAIRSMPSIPFFGSLFSTSSPSKEMSYPDQRSKEEWQAVLNKGMISDGTACCPFRSVTDFFVF